ncbi:MAG: hypothetical protein KY445_14965 [Armatimonadetes bacterium]|nr:hypothetical protein [Armatimonadota bacterium]
MKKIVLIMLFVVSTLCCAKSVWAKSSPYAIDVRRVHKNRNLLTIRLWDKKTKRILWTRARVENQLYDIQWSKDRRAVAVGYFSPNSDDFQILIWREGYRLRTFAIPGGVDYSMGMVWSPDKRRLLIRGGGSGSSDVDAGPLYCLTLGRWPYYRVDSIPFSDGGVRTMTWKDKRTVLYKELVLDANGSKVLIKPRVWRVPRS